MVVQTTGCWVGVGLRLHLSQLRRLRLERRRHHLEVSLCTIREHPTLQHRANAIEREIAERRLHSLPTKTDRGSEPVHMVLRSRSVERFDFIYGFSDVTTENEGSSDGFEECLEERKLACQNFSRRQASATHRVRHCPRTSVHKQHCTTCNKLISEASTSSQTSCGPTIMSNLRSNQSKAKKCAHDTE